MKKMMWVLGVSVLLSACATPTVDMPVQSGVSLERYVGTWHEQARLPNRFQKDCAADVRADYALNPDGSLTVTNQCRKEDGSIKLAEGEGRLASSGPRNPAKLEVRFAPKSLGWLPMVWGDYWILRLDDDYQYSLVGTPDRKYLWVLSREEQADTRRVQQLLDYARTQGFPVEEVVRRP